MDIDVPIRCFGQVAMQDLSAAILAQDEAAWNENTQRQQDYEVHEQTRSIVLLFADVDAWPEVSISRKQGWDRLGPVGEGLARGRAQEALCHIRAARRTSKFVVLDVPHQWNACVKDVLERANDVLIVAPPDLEAHRDLLPASNGGFAPVPGPIYPGGFDTQFHSYFDGIGAYGNSTVFLILGGFLVALAMERWNLHKRLAYSVVVRAGDRPRLLVLGMMVATAFVSMWASNTSTTLMMIPVALSIAAVSARAGVLPRPHATVRQRIFPVRVSARTSESSARTSPEASGTKLSAAGTSTSRPPTSATSERR